MFTKASESAWREIEHRQSLGKRVLRFGIEFLDDALRGIYPDDLILLGAPSGAGKTQICCNIALANLTDGKNVHYIALEASRFEIERRLKYPLVMERFYSDPDHARLGRKISFSDWLSGDFHDELKNYEAQAAEYFEKAFAGLHLLYKPDQFNINTLIESVLWCAKDTDLILIDHVHYFDFDDDNENRAIKEIAKTVRCLALEQQKPIILVAHLRKRDRNNDDLVSGLDEFHGSSDLYKIATRVVTIAPGRMTEDGNYETFFRIPKNRLDGGVSRFIGREIFSPKKGGYERGQYRVGDVNQSRKRGFEELAAQNLPGWAKRNSSGGDSIAKPKRQFWNAD